MTTDMIKNNALTRKKAAAGRPVPVAVAYGDGIGPEIMEAAIRVMDAAGAKIDWRRVEMGESFYLKGHTSGIDPAAWDVIRETGVLFKGPITTPQGGGYKSLNVTMRKTLGLYANVRPCISYAPYVPTKHPNMDVVIVRENEEDLYAGIEHRQTDEVYQCLKIVSRPGTEKIVRYAFDYARAHGRRRVTCLTKDNIMKMTDGLFHKVFDEIGAEYPEIIKDHMIIDIGAARMADDPTRFDVIVTPNLYGDIVSDIAAEVAGSVGLAGSANIGETGALFEAIHGSAPDIAGRNIANPSGLLMAGVMMLAHIGQTESAENIRNAWLRALEDGVATADIFDPARGQKALGTREFAEAVIVRLSQNPRHFKPATIGNLPSIEDSTAAAAARATPPPADKQMVGVDIFLHHNDRDPDALAARIKNIETNTGLILTMITNRGVKVWPQGLPETFCTDHWRCRFEFAAGMKGGTWMVLQQMAAMDRAGFDVIKTENLYTFDGKPGYSLGQGQ